MHYCMFVGLHSFVFEVISNIHIAKTNCKKPFWKIKFKNFRLGLEPDPFVKSKPLNSYPHISDEYPGASHILQVPLRGGSDEDLLNGEKEELISKTSVEITALKLEGRILQGN